MLEHISAAISLRFPPHTRCTPSPLVGEGWGGGWCGDAPTLPHTTTPTPNPSPQGGGERTECAARVAP